MNKVVLICKMTPNTETNRQLVIAALADLDFSDFQETEEGVQAYIQEDTFDIQKVKKSPVLSAFEDHLTFSYSTIEEQDWNKTWEMYYFKPIVINNQCVVRSEFHTPHPDFRYEIIINPKMAFGTGHHQTTHLMIQTMLRHNFQNKNILDMGTGTGILAILSNFKGAKEITAIDIEEWAYNNALENIERNQGNNINLIKGDVTSIPDKLYDIILANINFSVLQKDLPYYNRYLNSGGKIFLSGFYENSMHELMEIAQNESLHLSFKDKRDDWMILVLSK